jgi:hypothetical protein
MTRLTLKSGQRPARRPSKQRIPLPLFGASEQWLKQLPRNPERKPAFKLPAASRQDPHPRQSRTLPGHSQQDALADTRWTGDQQHVPAARLRQGEQGVDPAELIVALKQASLH